MRGAISIRVLRLEVHARLRRLRCPERGALVDGVPFARGDARFTRDFEDLVAWLATKTDKTATCPLTRIDWHTIGRGAQQRSPRSMVSFSSCPTVGAGHGIRGAWLEVHDKLEPSIFVRSAKLNAVSEGHG